MDGIDAAGGVGEGVGEGEMVGVGAGAEAKPASFRAVVDASGSRNSSTTAYTRSMRESTGEVMEGDAISGTARAARKMRIGDNGSRLGTSVEKAASVVCDGICHCIDLWL